MIKTRPRNDKSITNSDNKSKHNYYVSTSLSQTNKESYPMHKTNVFGTHDKSKLLTPKDTHNKSKDNNITNTKNAK